MKPKEKAEELYFKYHNLWINGNSIMAKQCALIAVDELIISSPSRSPINDSSDFMPHFTAIKYWKEVKQEIEKL